MRPNLRNSILANTPNMNVPVGAPQTPSRAGVWGSNLVLVRQDQEKAKPGFTETDAAADEILQKIVAACASNVAVLDESGVVRCTSKAWLAFGKANGLTTEFGEAAVYFEKCKKLADRTDNQPANATLADDIRQLRLGRENEFHGEYYYSGLSQPSNFAVHGARLDLPTGAFRILITHQDVMSRAETLRRSEQFSQLLEKTKIVVWEAAADTWQFTYISDQATRIFGYPLKQWYEPGFLALHIHRKDRDRTLSFFRMQSQVAEQYDFTFRLLAKDGRVVWVHNLVSVARENSKPVNLRGFMIDITDQKCAEEALRDLGGRLIAAQEEERSRVARELHDDLNQRMAILSIELEQLGQAMQKQPGLRRRFRALQRQAQEISADLHRLSYKLHPSKLDHLGLGPSVKSLCEELARNRRLKIELRQKGFPATLPGDVTVCVFRIVQEALSNCLKHSSAQAAQVVLEKTGSAIHLSVSDNGCGFDPESHLNHGLGFISMRERVRLIAGEMHVYSRPQCGTRIEVVVPLVRESESVID